MNSGIAIIGAGKLGTHLFYSLKNAGYHNIKRVEKKHSEDYFKKTIKSSNIIFICTRDSEIGYVVKKIKPFIISTASKLIFHTSGALNSEILKTLKNKNNYTGSFHPVQTFASKSKGKSDKFKNIYISIEGDDIAIETGIKLARKLDSLPVILSKRNKLVHHINSVFASNYLISLFEQIRIISDKSHLFGKNNGILINGFKRVNFFAIYEPLVKNTLNNIKNKGLAASLTGPVERNDISTIKAHLSTLRKVNKDAVCIYAALGIETTKIALIKKSLTKYEAGKIINLFKKYLKIQTK